MFFDQGVFTMEGDGVKIQVKGSAPVHADALHGIKPQPHHVRIGSGIDAATVFGQKRPFWNRIKAGK